MDDEWDLNAIVRGYTTNSSTTAAATATTANTTVDDYDDPFCKLQSLVRGDDDKPFSYPAFGENRNEMSGGLEEVYKEGCSQPLPANTAADAAAAASSSSAVPVDRRGFVHEQLPMLRDSHSFSIHTVDRSPKRKKQQKKIVLHLTQEELSGDTWAWRKYGQKPIKGSPYPRNYYRCSTTKACGARKQVERSPMDPSVFIVSYYGEHIHPRPTHRSSLAGSTRSNKFIAVDNNKPPAATCSSSSPPSASSFSPTTSLKDEESEMNDEDEDDEDILIPNAVVSDELLRGFHGLKSGGGGGSF